MSESDVETLFEEPLAATQTLVQQQPATKPSLGERSLIWKRKFLERLKYRFTIASLKAQGCTKEEIVDELPEYYYDEEYHGLTEEPWFRRNKSTADLRSCVGSNTGYSGYEFVGPDRPELWNGIEQTPSIRRLSLDCKIS